jgi:hypothetical protein
MLRFDVLRRYVLFLQTVPLPERSRMRLADDLLLRSSGLHGRVNLQELVMKSVAFVFLASVACGTTTEPLDASVTDSGGDATNQDSSTFPDVGPFDGGGDGGYYGFVIVDGGTACNPPGIHCGFYATYTCCNGVLCAGVCILFADASAPECYCAGFAGGCPGQTACCFQQQTCVADAGDCAGPPCP